MNDPQPDLTAEDRAHVIRLLEESENEFLELVSNLTDDQWSWKASPDCWSIAETAEHLVLGERLLLERVRETLNSPPAAAWQEQDAYKTRFVGRALLNRGHKADAPAPLAPHHHWTRAEAVARYREGRARTLEFAGETDRPMKDRWSKHPFPVFDMLNGYHWLLYIPLHNSRHNQQIAEILKEMPA